MPSANKSVGRAARRRPTGEDQAEFFRVLETVRSVPAAAAELGLLAGACYNWLAKFDKVAESLWKQWPQDRREYTAEERQRFLRAMDSGVTVAEAAEALGLNVNVCYHWARGAKIPARKRVHAGREEYHRLRKTGLSATEAARAVGAHPRTGRRWDAARFRDTAKGKVRAEPVKPGYNQDMPATTVAIPDGPGRPISSRYLSLAERETIYDLRRAGEPQRRIAAVLRRPVSTISRELARNAVPEAGYLPHAAHRVAAARRPRPKPSKLADEGKLREYVKSKLDIRWSPEQISNTLVKEFPDDPEMRVSHETIYQAVYLQARGGLKREVEAALRTGRTRRKTRRTGEHRTPRFGEEMPMISDRPPEVEDRAVPGHWEGDLITGKLNQTAIGTLVERTTRYVMLVHLPTDHGAISVRDGLVKVMSSLPEHLRGSLTWDQGSEMAAYKSFSMASDMDVYFCDPASPWQRGSNENMNGLLRQYFPKGTDLSIYGPEDLEHVAQEINGRPRKTLGWDTPAERLRDLLLTT